MNRREQRRFVKELTKAVTNQLLALIHRGSIPDTWDGHELRCLMADHYEASAKVTIVRRNPRGARARDYKNECLVRDLS